jgi:hypothetical protein
MSDVGLVGTNPTTMSDEDEEEMEQRAELAALQVNSIVLNQFQLEILLSLTVHAN